MIVRSKVLAFAAVGALALVLRPPMALAVDGAREIHQACVATGCFPGDTAGWPVLITEPGSYVLTSGLTVPDANTTAISIDAPHVSLDLHGFSITGPNTCDFGNGTCGGGGSMVCSSRDSSTGLPRCATVPFRASGTAACSSQVAARSRG